MSDRKFRIKEQAGTDRRKKLGRGKKKAVSKTAQDRGQKKMIV